MTAAASNLFYSSPVPVLPPDTTPAAIRDALIDEERAEFERAYHGLSFLLAASLVAVLAGAKSFYAIERRIHDLSLSLMAKLGGTWCYFLQGYRFPDEKAIRMLLNDVDADELDRIFGGWLFGNTRVADDDLLVLAIDGKVMRGAWTDENEKFTLFSAMVHDLGVTVAQVAVPSDTDEITQVENLLDALPIGEDQDVLVTMDAAHTQRDTAEHIVGDRGFDYIAAIKGNQPTLHEEVVDVMIPVLSNDPEYDATERGHGRIGRWRTWTADSGTIDFLHLERIACIRRDTYTLDGTWTSKEFALFGTGDADMTASRFHTHVRKHWGIENKTIMFVTPYGVKTSTRLAPKAGHET